MIIWLASYPRSGNTLLRLVLKQVFDQVSHSKYDDVDDIGRDDAVRKRVGHEFLQGDWKSEYERFREADEKYFVKTHDRPQDDGRTIYVVRNGFDAIWSYKKYLEKIVVKNAELTEVIAGSVGHFPSWGTHLDAWNPLQRPNTLLLKYEAILDDPDSAITEIAAFCDLPVLSKWVNDFSALQERSPAFFRAAERSGYNEHFSAEERRVFAALHGDWMLRLGYPLEVDTPSVAGLRAVIEPADAIEYKGYKRGTEDGMKAGREKSRKDLQLRNAKIDSLESRLREEIRQSETLKRELDRCRHPIRYLIGSAMKDSILQRAVSRVRGVAANRKTATAPTQQTQQTRSARPTRTFSEFFEHVKGLGFQPKTVFDVGVAAGTPTIYQAFPDAYYFLFEPVKDFEQDLKRILKRYRGEYHICALMSEPGEGTILRTENKYGASMMHRIDDSANERLQNVHVSTLDSVLAERDVEGPFLLKTDCQGGDFAVLKGAVNTLERCELVIAEVSFFKFWGGHHPDPLEIFRFMDGHGFVIYDILDGLFRPSDNALGQVDFAFVKRDGMFRQSHKW